MGNRNWMVASFAALSAVLAVANAAQAEERLLSSNYAREFRGEQAIDLDYELQLGGLRARLNSVVLIASSAAGRGQVELVVDGQVLDRRQVGTRMESIQFLVGRELWPRTRSVSLSFRGNFTVAFLGATVEEDFGGRPDRREPRDPRYPQPAPRPEPRPAPMPVPGPSYPQFVSEVEFSGFMRELQMRVFDSDKEQIVRQYASFWSTRVMSMHQLGATLGQFKFDDGRLMAVRAFDRIVQVDMSLMNTILSKFDFESNREQARRILTR